MSKADDPKVASTSGVTPGYEDAPAPGPIKENGQNASYWILSEEERAKGFVRPVRNSYEHVGIAGPQYPLRDLNEKEKADGLDQYGWIKFEEFPSGSSAVGRYWSQKDLDRVGKGCGTVTTMGRALAETYARNPNFYGATFCCGCGKHLPVGEDGEFIWVEGGDRVGT